MGTLDHRVYESLILLGNAKLFFKSGVLIYILTSRVCAFSLLLNLINSWLYCTSCLLAALEWSSLYLIYMLCHEVEHPVFVGYLCFIFLFGYLSFLLICRSLKVHFAFCYVKCYNYLLSSPIMTLFDRHRTLVLL